MIHHSMFQRSMTKMIAVMMMITTMIVTINHLKGPKNGKHQLVKPSLSSLIQRDRQLLSTQDSGQSETHFLRQHCLGYLRMVPGHITASASGQKGEDIVDQTRPFII